MGRLIIVTEDVRDRRRRVRDRQSGPVAPAGIAPGRFLDADGNEKILYIEWGIEPERMRRRREWLATEEGRTALDKALEADARGECACDDLLRGTA